MWPSVANAFFGFSTKFEGRISYMYTDSKGYVTTGIGNLIENIASASLSPSALALPWKHSNGALATSDEIEAEFSKMKAAWPKVQSVGCKSIATLFLDDSAINSLVQGQMQADAAQLAKSFPAYATMPADSQLGLHSMAWAMGAGFAPGFPQFTKAVNAGQFGTAAPLSQISSKGNPGIIPRNVANALLFNNAQAVIDNGLDPSVLYYPGKPSPSGSIIPIIAGAGALIIAAIAIYAGSKA